MSELAKPVILKMSYLKDEDLSELYKKYASFEQIRDLILQTAMTTLIFQSTGLKGKFNEEQLKIMEDGLKNVPSDIRQAMENADYEMHNDINNSVGDDVVNGKMDDNNGQELISPPVEPDINFDAEDSVELNSDLTFSNVQDSIHQLIMTDSDISAIDTFIETLKTDSKEFKNTISHLEKMIIDSKVVLDSAQFEKFSRVILNQDVNDITAKQVDYLMGNLLNNKEFDTSEYKELLASFIKVRVNEMLPGKDLKITFVDKIIGSKDISEGYMSFNGFLDDEISINNSRIRYRGIGNEIKSVFHELRHMLQKYKITPNSTNLSYSEMNQVKDNFIKGNFVGSAKSPYYGQNYNYISFELDADIYGYEMTLEYMKKYAPDSYEKSKDAVQNAIDAYKKGEKVIPTLTIDGVTLDRDQLVSYILNNSDSLKVDQMFKNHPWLELEFDKTTKKRYTVKEFQQKMEKYKGTPRYDYIQDLIKNHPENNSVPFSPVDQYGNVGNFHTANVVMEENGLPKTDFSSYNANVNSLGYVELTEKKIDNK